MMKPEGSQIEKSLFERSAGLLEALGLCRASEILEVRPLAGGVASDIAAVRFGARTVCVKFALPKLRVAADWYAPVSRGRSEFNWLLVARAIVPEATPELFGWSDEHGGFAMEFLSGPDVHVWKAALLAGISDGREAAGVARVLGSVHRASVQAAFDPSPFHNSGDFDALRLEPYLRFTAERHPDLASDLIEMADALKLANKVLVHGDVSPKNILMRDGGPVLLDAECATMGDPCFDVAFCLNHLILKSVHLPRSRDRLLAAFLKFWEAYSAHVCWEDPSELETRTARLLPMLLLARVDGKSPVEYLTRDEQAFVRGLARSLIVQRVDRHAELVRRISLEARS